MGLNLHLFVLVDFFCVTTYKSFKKSLPVFHLEEGCGSTHFILSDKEKERGNEGRMFIICWLSKANICTQR